MTLRDMACNQPTPLCKEWTEAWADDTDIDVLLDKFVLGLDFCVKNNYPPLAFCREHFDREDLHRHHIFIDEEVSIKTKVSGFWVFLGHCTGKVIFDGYSVATVYLRHISDLRIIARDSSKVFLTLYDDSNAQIEQDEYGGTFKVYDRRKGER